MQVTEIKAVAPNDAGYLDMSYGGNQVHAVLKQGDAVIGYVWRSMDGELCCASGSQLLRPLPGVEE